MSSILSRFKVFFKGSIVFSVLVFTCIIGVKVANAAPDTHTWDGGGADNNWSTCANWNATGAPDVCPAGTDTVTFDGTSTKASTIDAGFGGTVANLNINSGYTGETAIITVSRSLTTGAAFSQADGTINCGSQTISIGTTFTLSGGTFNATTGTMTVGSTWTHTAGGTFTHNSGTVKSIINASTASSWNFNSSETFGDFTVDCNGDSACSGSNYGPYLAASDNLIVSGTLTLTDGTINYTTTDGGITAQGTVTIGSGWDSGGGTVSTLTFGGTSSQNFNISGAEALFNGSVIINNAAGVVLNSYLTLDAAGKDLTLTSGALNIASNSLTVADDLNYNGGTLTNTGGNTITVNDWSQSTGTFSGSNSTIIINATFNLSGGTFNATTGTMTVGTTWTHTAVGSTFTHNNGTVKAIIDASTASSWNFNSSETFGNFIVDCNGDSACNGTNYGPYLASGDNLIVEGTLTLTDGTINYNTVDGGITVKGNVVVGSGWDGVGSLPVLTFAGTSPQTFDLTGATGSLNGDITINGASTVVNLASDLVMDASNQDLTVTAGTIDLSGAGLTVNGTGGTFTVASGANLQLQGGETVTGTPTLNAGSTVTYDGTSGPYTMADWTYTNATLVINGGASSVFTLGATETINNVTITSGILSLGGNGLTVSTTFSNDGTLRRRGNEAVTLTMDTDSGTVEVTGDGDSGADTYTITAISTTYYNLTINSTDGATDTFQLGATIDINGDFTLSAGTFDVSADNRAITVGGGWTDTGAGAFVERTGTVTFDGTGTLNSNEAFNNITMNTSGTGTLGAALDVDGTLTLTAGALDVSGSNYGITVAGGWTDTGAGMFIERSGTVTFDGTGTLNSNEAFNNVTINTAGTTTLGAALDVDGTLTLTAGTFDVSGSNYGITVAGNWSKTGTFTPRSGTVTFDGSGTGTISGSTSFNNFTCTTAGKPLVFTATTTQTITGTFTMTGASGNTIVLRSSSSGTQWNLTISGSSSISYVDVKDSNASGGNAINAKGTNSVNSGNNLGWTFNTAPTVSSVTASEATDGSGGVTVSFILDDDDDDTNRVLVEYNAGAGWVKATLSETTGTGSTYGSFNLENDNSYQVGNSNGYISTSPGANTITVRWNSKTDVLTADLSTAQVRITPYDGYDIGSAQSSANFIVDNVSPVSLAGFSAASTTSSTITWTWTASTDSHFNHYEIWYGTNQTDVTNRNGTASEWDNDPNDAALATATTATTTITGLSENTTYYAKIWAVDNYGNEATLTVATANNNGKPTIGSVTVVQSSNGNQYVTVQFALDDADDTDTGQALIQYNVGSGWAKATLSETTGTGSTYGQFNVENDNTYQIGNSNGYIWASPGANTISVVWRSDLDAAGIDLETVQIKITPYDGIESGAAVTSDAFIVDGVAPTTPGSLTKSGGSGTTAVLTWTAATESHFNHYEIWYGTTQTDVNNRNGTASEWDNDPNDALLATKTTATTTVTGLTPGATYYAKICSVDNYGYEGCGSAISFVTNQTPTASTVTAVQATDGTSNVTVTFIIDDADNDDTLQALVEYNVGAGWTKATLSSSGTGSTYGNFNLNNSNTYQVGNSSGYILTSPGANTITVIWASASDVSSTNISTAKVRATPYDGMAAGTAVESSNFILDQVAPSGGLTSLTSESITETGFTLGWDVITSESNFDKYEIYYRPSGGTYTLYGTDGTIMANSSINISGLTKGTTYDFYVKALDTKGNSLSSSTLTATMKNYENPAFGEVTGGGGGGGYTSSTSSTSDNESNEQADSTEEETTDNNNIAGESEEEPGYNEPHIVEIDIESTDNAEEAVIEFDAEWEADIAQEIGDNWAEPYLKTFFQNTLLSELLTGGDDMSDSEAAVISYFFDPNQSVTRIEFLRSAMDLLGIEPSEDVSGLPLTDVLSSVSDAQYVMKAYEMGAIKGYSDFTFRPNQYVNRAEAIKIVLALGGENVITLYGKDLLEYYGLPANPFSDVDLNAWYAPYVMYSYSNGIVIGYGDGTFKPDRVISLGETAKIVTLVMELG